MVRPQSPIKICRQSLASAVVASLLVCSPALANSEASVSTAREIAKEGLNAYDAGRYAEANEKLSRALEVVGVPTLALYTARANVKLGKLVRASELYLLATRLEPKGPSETVQLQAQKEATKERAELLPRIPRLTVSLEGAELDTVEVSIDGQPVPKALLGTSQLVDPGRRKVSAKRGEELVSAEVDIAEQEHKSTTMRFAPLEKFGQVDAVPTAETKTQPPTNAGEKNPLGSTPPPLPQDPHKTQRILGWIGVGVGSAGVAFGTIAGGIAMTKRSNMRDAGDCNSANSCYEDKQLEVDSYNSMRRLSSIGFIAGGVVAAAGVTLLLTTPKSEGGRNTALVLAPGTATLVGRF